jgi:hypothetical protein
MSLPEELRAELEAALPCHYEHPGTSCVMCASRAAVEPILERLAAGPRCSITGHPCGTDTWNLAHPPDCHCGVLYAKLAAAEEKAETYRRDWYDAKSEFGDAMAKMRQKLRHAEAERDRVRGELRGCEQELIHQAGLRVKAEAELAKATEWREWK